MVFRVFGFTHKVVSVPEASSPAALVVPAGHDTHAFADTYSFAAHNVASQVVSVPEASSPAARVVPAAHAILVFEETYSSAEQIVEAVGLGGEGGGDGATQVLLIVSHELAGPVTASSHDNLA